MPDFFEAVRSGRVGQPKTVLGFFAIVLGIVATVSASITLVLAATKTSTWLIPVVLSFLGLFILGVVVAVFVVMLRNPSKLMLTGVSGKEYVDIYRAVTLGDSTSGIRSQSQLPVAVVALSDEQNAEGDGAR